MASVDQDSGDENPNFVSPVQNSSGGGDALVSAPTPVVVSEVPSQPPTQVGTLERPAAEQYTAEEDPEKRDLRYRLRISELETQVKAAQLEASEAKQRAAEAAQAQQVAQQQIAQQRASSALAIQQQQLTAAIQRQAQAAKVGKQTRRRVGTPAALRTNLELQSSLALGSTPGVGSETQSGGLNV